MKKFVSVLLLVLAVVIIAVTLCNHPNLSKNPAVSNSQQQGILPGGCVVDNIPTNTNSNMLVIAHVLGIAFILCGVILALTSLKDKKQLHSDEEFAKLQDELTQAQTKLEEGNKLLEDLKVSVEANKANLEKIETENKAAVEAKMAELAKCKEETQAALSRAENLEKDNKGVKREVEKLNSQLKAGENDKEQLKSELLQVRKELEAKIEELKAVEANTKGGKEAIPPAAYQILYLLQKEGRLIDFLNEDISEFDDETLGGAIRPIHEGCAKLLKERLVIEPVLNEEEGSEVTIDDADPESIKLSGKVPASGPYKGELIHRGWRLKECNLPELVDGWKGNVIAPAEIEM